MSLPVASPVQPQLARSRDALPEGEGWAYEPKYDGFRAIVFVDGDDIEIQSRGLKPLRRYFPEVEFPAGRYVVDGELVIEGAGGGESFSLLSNRIHPAVSRIERLAAETPARFIAFDLLAREDTSLMELPFAERRVALEALGADLGIRITDSVRTPAEAEHWLRDAEGVIGKLLDSPYRPGKRDAMVKVKRLRSLDAVCVGWRPGKEEGTLGSLILGLYTADGDLRVVGHTSGFKAKEKRELPAKLAPYETGERGSADPSRWKADKELEWIALRPELVVEVAYDHVSDGRIRHGTKLLRWREDKPPRECSIEQLDA